MKEKYFKISDAAKDELRDAKIEGNKLYFSSSVKNYAEMKKLMPHLGIEWSKKDKVHYIAPDTLDKIAELLSGARITDEKKTFQAFFTPPDLAQRVVDMADVSNQIVLEPSCGVGNLLVEIRNFGAANIKAVEIKGEFAEEARSKGFVVANMDFLNLSPNDDIVGYVDRIVMNSPYDRNTWVRHLEHAWKFLKEGGKMVAICPAAKQNKAFQKFAADKRYEITPVEAGAFKSSGTNIATMILEIWK